jgi:hypothetical protein
MSGLGAADYFEKPIDFVRLKSRLSAELSTRPVERRAHVRVRMKLILKLKGVDEAQRSFEQLSTTENVSAGGFLCALNLSLSPNSSFQVFLSTSGRDQYVGTVRVVRKDAAGTPWQSYAFEFIERTPEWILQD